MANKEPTIKKMQRLMAIAYADNHKARLSIGLTLESGETVAVDVFRSIADVEALAQIYDTAVEAAEKLRAPLNLADDPTH